jgi:hypothetical protein
MNHASKWERHAWSAYLDLVATESERDLLLERVRVLEEAAKAVLRVVTRKPITERMKVVINLRAALAAKGE